MRVPWSQALSHSVSLHREQVVIAVSKRRLVPSPRKLVPLVVSIAQIVDRAGPKLLS